MWCPDLTYRQSLEELVVLRVDGLPDLAVRLACSFERSCCGMSLEQLVCCERPVCEHCDLPGPIMSIPKELWRLGDQLSRGGLRLRGLLQEPGDDLEVGQPWLGHHAVRSWG